MSEPRLHPQIANVVTFLRDAWRHNDGAEGDAVRVVCDHIDAQAELLQKQRQEKLDWMSRSAQHAKTIEAQAAEIERLRAYLVEIDALDLYEQYREEEE